MTKSEVRSREQIKKSCLFIFYCFVEDDPGFFLVVAVFLAETGFFFAVGVRVDGFERIVFFGGFFFTVSVHPTDGTITCFFTTTFFDGGIVLFSCWLGRSVVVHCSDLVVGRSVVARWVTFLFSLAFVLYIIHVEIHRSYDNWKCGQKN